jgi:hypothetical protein
MMGLLIGYGSTNVLQNDSWNQLGACFCQTTAKLNQTRNQTKPNWALNNW